MAETSLPHAAPHAAPRAAQLAPITTDAFLADRQRFWGAFTSFTVGGIVAVILAVLLTLYFIL